MFKSLPFRRATTLGLALIVALLLGNVAVSLWNTEVLIENGRRVVYTQRELTTLEEVLARVTEAETSERGFLITGDPDYLHSYQNAAQRSGETLERMTRLVSEDPVQHKRVEELKKLIDARFKELERAIVAHQDGGFNAARHSVSTNQGRQLMNSMRNLVGEMQQHEEQALEVRSEESQRSARVTMIVDLAGSFLGISMVVLAHLLFRRELAHRQRADDASRRLAAMVESSDDAILTKSPEGIIVSWNSGATQIYGYTPEEVVGRSVYILCPPDGVEEAQSIMERAKRGGHIEHFETTRIRKDGRRIDVSLTISPIKDSTGSVIGVSAIARDVTEHKRLQREVLEIAAREQQRIGQDLHDGTGQELTGLAMMTERLANEMAAHSMPQARTAARIVDCLEQALSHVRALSKGLVPVELDSEGLMVALAELADRTGELHGVQCTFRCDEPVEIRDNQTATHLYRLSQEAVTNAVKHGRPRSIVIDLTDDGELITLSVSDDGAGLAPDHHTASGTGLRIMRYRAELIRAKLTIHRGPQGGTRVTCTLPRQQVSWPADLAAESVATK